MAKEKLILGTETESEKQVSESERVVKGERNNVSGILDESIKAEELIPYETDINLSEYFDRKLGRSLTEEAKPYTFWGQKDGKYFRILNFNSYEADVAEYAKCTLESYKYEVIKDFISDKSFTCEMIDVIEKDLTLEQVKTTGGARLSFMSIEELNEIV